MGYNFDCKLETAGNQPRRTLINIVSPSTRIFKAESDSPKDLDRPQLKVILDKDGNVMPMGLMPVRNPGAYVIRPFIFTQTRFARRK